MERGVYVKRINRAVFDGSEDWNTWGVNFGAEGITGFYFYTKRQQDPESYLIDSTKNSVLCNMFPYLTDVYQGKKFGISYSSYSNSNDMQYIMLGVYNTYLNDYSSDGAAVTSFKQLLSENPMVVYAPLLTPVESPIPEEELAAFRKAVSNAPNTMILSDENINMEVDAIAEPSKWIENKIAEVASTLMEVN